MLYIYNGGQVQVDVLGTGSARSKVRFPDGSSRTVSNNRLIPEPALHSVLQQLNKLSREQLRGVVLYAADKLTEGVVSQASILRSIAEQANQEPVINTLD